ncbi:Ctf8-domain-containing protein [Russula vinacea]|nr:Ctf8-domain-containing protein [Russula vinacea]
MILPLTLPAKSSSPDSPALPPALARLGSSELFLLELQGELEVSGDKHGQLVGRLTIDDTNDGKGKPTLRIGHHLLEGKIVSLPKPLAVLQRICAPPPPQPPQTDKGGDGDVDVDVAIQHGDNKDDNNVATSYAIRTLIRKKIVFSKRPTPIVGLSVKMSS